MKTPQPGQSISLPSATVTDPASASSVPVAPMRLDPDRAFNGGLKTHGASDLLYGADEIATFLFGDRKHRRRLYRKIAKKNLPVFRIGHSICARKSVLLAWIEAQERAR